METTRRNILGALSALVAFCTAPFAKKGRNETTQPREPKVLSAFAEIKGKQVPIEEINEDLARRLASARARLENDPGFAGRAFKIDEFSGATNGPTNRMATVPVGVSVCKKCGESIGAA